MNLKGVLTLPFALALVLLLVLDVGGEDNEFVYKVAAVVLITCNAFL